MSILLKEDLMKSLSKIPMAVFTDIQKLILIFIWNLRRLQIAKTILEKNKNKIVGLTIPNFKKNPVWHWHKDRHTDLWNTTENSEI